MEEAEESIPRLEEQIEGCAERKAEEDSKLEVIFEETKNITEQRAARECREGTGVVGRQAEGQEGGIQRDRGRADGGQGARGRGGGRAEGFDGKGNDVGEEEHGPPDPGRGGPRLDPIHHRSLARRRERSRLRSGLKSRDSSGSIERK